MVFPRLWPKTSSAQINHALEMLRTGSKLCQAMIPITLGLVRKIVSKLAAGSVKRIFRIDIFQNTVQQSQYGYSSRLSIVGALLRER